MAIKRIRFAMLMAATVLMAGCGGSSGTIQVVNLGSFKEAGLTADTAGKATYADANLVNPWGIATNASGGPFSVSDNGPGVVTVYNSVGLSQGTVITIPAAGGGSNGPVSGQVFNGTTDFNVGGGGPATFIFVSEDGLVNAWSSGAKATTMADRSAGGTVYKGVAIGSSNGANFLFATDFHNGNIDIFDKNFAFVKSVTDPTMAIGFAPFGIANIGGTLFVSFAMQNAAKHDDVAGHGNGFVDEFKTDGTFLRRLISRGALNSPWAMVLAPPGFGNAGNTLLVGNFGDGHINAFDPNRGGFLSSLNDNTGLPITVPGLWGLIFGNGGSGGASGVLYFTSGPNGEADGLFGSVSSS